MKNKSTGFQKKKPHDGKANAGGGVRERMPNIKKSNFLYSSAVVAIIALLAGAAYLIWSMPGRDAEQAPLKINTGTPPGPAPEGMVWVPGGEFWMGGEIETFDKRPAEDSLPLHRVYVDGFWMDRHEVTNEKWALFVKETGYRTVAEQKPDPRDFPGAKEEDLKEPFSIVFTPPKEFIHDINVAHLEHRWWSLQKGACWLRPEGKDSTIKGKENYPAVHIAYVDALEYCRWLSKKSGKTCRLPTEAEWEFAARGGLDRKLYAWGDELTPKGKWMANIWQGKFPNENSALDGFAGLAPVGSFPANGYGLHDMAGNAWEWCQDYYQADYYSVSPSKNPRGPAGGLDPREPDQAKRVQRGGSFLCADNYCIRYLAAARGKGEEKSAANHIGFRCIQVAK